jgi:hypothetical protein
LILDAAGVTNLPEATFPRVSPWSFDDIMDDDVWPGDAEPPAKV